MVKKILFVSKYKENIEEFKKAMANKSDIDIDIAENGIAAAALLKKREYQVVITGLTLGGYNGEQLITYINQTFPNTVCIIYTTNISTAQLHFFINKRNVFRVFLRPVDFEVEFAEALEEAFEYYGIKVKDKEERVKSEEQMAQYKERISQMRNKIANQSRTKIALARYMRRMVVFSIQEYAKDITPEGKKRLEGFEFGLIELCCGENEGVTEGIERAEDAVKHIREIAQL